MNTDIRLSVGFWQHPKTKKTAKRLGLEGVRSLQILWLWAATNRPDGSLVGMDWEDIELAADWQGEERAFFDFCLDLWIDDTPESYTLHDWAEHNPWQAEADARSEKAKKAAQARWENAKGSNEQCSKNAQRMLEHNSSNAPSPSPEELRINSEFSYENSSFCAELENPAPPSSPAPPAEIPEVTHRRKQAPHIIHTQNTQLEDFTEIVAELPVSGSPEYKTALFTAGYVQELEELFPGVDVGRQFKLMAQWHADNPSRKKTLTGIRRFVTGWLAREQNNAKNTAMSPQGAMPRGQPVFFDKDEVRRQKNIDVCRKVLHERAQRTTGTGEGDSTVCTG